MDERPVQEERTGTGELETPRKQCFEKLGRQAGLPGGPVAKTLGSQCRGPGLDLWSGN